MAISWFDKLADSLASAEADGKVHLSFFHAEG